MVQKAKSNHVILRPHFKTHQSRIIGKWFKKAKVDKIAVSSFSMAEYFANDGWKDITVAFPVNIREIEKINEFQFGRAQSTKENQLYEQYLNLEYVTDLISGVKNEIAYTEISKTNQANDNPNELVLYFINSIKKSDFSQLRNIIDPYGEFDQNSLSILLLSQYNEKLKSEVLNQYSNSRIITSNNLNDNETIIEIATGVNSDFIKKIIVVKRLNKWYILSM